jgi:hypothetical protein
MHVAEYVQQQHEQPNIYHVASGVNDLATHKQCALLIARRGSYVTLSVICVCMQVNANNQTQLRDSRSGVRNILQVNTMLHY